MKKVLRIGIVGCGAIGGSLARTVKAEFSGRAKLTALFDIDPAKALALSRSVSGNVRLASPELAALICVSDLVIEASHARSSFAIARSAVSAGKDVMVMSVGGLVDRFDELARLAAARGATIHVPSGALAGIDGLKAACLGRIRSVVLTTRKNPRAFQGVAYVQRKKIDLARLAKDTVLFSGSARQATKYFPQNINVAAILSIAGIGSRRTRVRIVASPGVTKNIHEIRIQADAGTIMARTENILHPDNPKTSYLAVLSAQAMLKQLLGAVRIGT